MEHDTPQLLPTVWDMITGDAPDTPVDEEVWFKRGVMTKFLFEAFRAGVMRGSLVGKDECFTDDDIGDWYCMWFATTVQRELVTIQITDDDEGDG